MTHAFLVPGLDSCCVCSSPGPLYHGRPDENGARVQCFDCWYRENFPGRTDAQREAAKEADARCHARWP